MSSLELNAPSMSLKISLSVLWKTSEADVSPKNNRLYLLRPIWVENVVIYLDFSSSSI